MNEVLAISGGVWRRILSMGVVYFLVACAITEIFITRWYKDLMALEHRGLMVDLSLLLGTIASLLCVLALAFDIPRELREGTAATLLAKPLGRTQYLVGKYLGICIVAMVITALISLGFFVIHKLVFGNLPEGALAGHVLTLLAVPPMAALALLFSSVLGEAAAALLTAITVWLLHSVQFLSKFPLVHGLILDMNIFNLRAEATYDYATDWSYVALAALYAVLYSIAMVGIASILFNQRDLK